MLIIVGKKTMTNIEEIEIYIFKENGDCRRTFRSKTGEGFEDPQKLIDAINDSIEYLEGMIRNIQYESN